MDLFQITLQTSPKQHPPKTTTQESYLKTMISKDLKGFGLYPLVEKKNPPLGRAFINLFTFLLKSSNCSNGVSLNVFDFPPSFHILFERFGFLDFS